MEGDTQLRAKTQIAVFGVILDAKGEKVVGRGALYATGGTGASCSTSAAAPTCGAAKGASAMRVPVFPNSLELSCFP